MLAIIIQMIHMIILCTFKMKFWMKVTTRVFLSMMQHTRIPFTIPGMLLSPLDATKLSSLPIHRLVLDTKLPVCLLLQLYPLHHLLLIFLQTQILHFHLSLLLLLLWLDVDHQLAVVTVDAKIINACVTAFITDLNANMNTAQETVRIKDIVMDRLVNVHAITHIMVAIVAQFYTIAHANTELVIN